MPLQPLIALQGQPVQIATADPIQQAAGLAHLAAYQDQALLRRAQLAQLAQEQANDAAFRAHFGQARQTAAPLSALATPAAPVSQDLTETVTRQEPGAAPMTTTTRVPGQVVPGSAGPASAAPGVAQSPYGAMFSEDDWRVAVRLKGKAGLETLEMMQKLRRGDPEAAQKMTENALKGYELLDRAYGGVRDQATLDQTRAYLQGLHPALAQTMPTTYTPEAIQQARAQLVPMKERLQHGQKRTGLQPVYGTDETGSPVLMQLNSEGEAVRTALPAGVTPTPGTQRIDLGTEWGVLDARTGQLIQRIPKDVRGEEAAKVEGKYAGELPERARKAHTAMQALEQQHSVVQQDIDRVLTLVKNNWATAGWAGKLASAVPGTDAYDVKALLNTIGANIGFDKLQEMRQASPTGGALGAVSDFENRQLQAILGSLDQAQSSEQFQKNLTRLKELLSSSKAKRTEAFQRDFGRTNLQAPTTPLSAPTSPGKSTQKPGTKSFTRAQIAEAAEANGMTVDEAEKLFTAEGYTIR